MLAESGQWWNIYIVELTKKWEQITQENQMSLLDFLYKESSLDTMDNTDVV